MARSSWWLTDGLAHVGLLAREYGDLARAQVALNEAKARFDALGDGRGQAHVLYTLTFMYSSAAERPTLVQQHLSMYASTRSLAT
jgi:hypothetical protein